MRRFGLFLRHWKYLMWRHGPKPDSHEAETDAEAEALTLISLEAEALVRKPKLKPGYLYYTHLQKKAWVNHETEAFGNNEAEARLSMQKSRKSKPGP